MCVSICVTHWYNKHDRVAFVPCRIGAADAWGTDDCTVHPKKRTAKFSARGRLGVVVLMIVA